MGTFLACVPHVLTGNEGSPKEEALLHRCRNERASGPVVIEVHYLQGYAGYDA